MQAVRFILAGQSFTYHIPGYQAVRTAHQAAGKTLSHTLAGARRHPVIARHKMERRPHIVSIGRVAVIPQIKSAMAGTDAFIHTAVIKLNQAGRSRVIHKLGTGSQDYRLLRRKTSHLGQHINHIVMEIHLHDSYTHFLEKSSYLTCHNFLNFYSIDYNTNTKSCYNKIIISGRRAPEKKYNS